MENSATLQINQQNYNICPYILPENVFPLQTLNTYVRPRINIIYLIIALIILYINLSLQTLTKN